jgi:hypothetical protein
LPALSKIVSVDDFGPTESGPNCTVSLHFFLGRSCGGQVVPTDLNSCGLPGGNAAIGFAKVIGGPFRAGFISVRVADLTEPTFTLPKFIGDGLTFRCSGTGVGVAVGVGVSVAVAVAVTVDVAVPVTVAVAVAVGVAVAVTVSVAVAVGVAVAVAVRVAVAVAVTVDVAVGVAVDVTV